MMRFGTFGQSVAGLLALILVLGAPLASLAQEATPQATPELNGPNPQLLSLLSLTPDVMSGDNATQGEIAEYADVAAQLEALGVTSPTSADDPGLRLWIRATM
ncbi:MAG: hypothetical protein ACJ789_03575 [Thermomicrobiales bacterium]